MNKGSYSIYSQACPRKCPTPRNRHIQYSLQSLLLCAFTLFKEGQCPYIEQKGPESQQGHSPTQIIQQRPW